jgi:hypothetical protein
MADRKGKDHPDHGTSHLQGGQAEELRDEKEFQSSESGGNMGAGHSGKDELGSQKDRGDADSGRTQYHPEH